MKLPIYIPTFGFDHIIRTANGQPLLDGAGESLTAGASRFISLRFALARLLWAAALISATLSSSAGQPLVQQAYVKSSNPELNDHFGEKVAVSGDILVVGAVREASNATGVNGNQSDNSATLAGAAYVFVRNGSSWSQGAYLKASNTEAFDGFGTSAAVSGDTIVVGAQNESSSATGVNGDQNNNNSRSSGAVYVFVRSGTTWTQQAYLKASNTGGSDAFGGSVAVSGDTIVVGASQEASNATGVDGDQSNNSLVNSGAAYVFVRNGTTWGQQAYLKASNPGFRDVFGGSVAVSGDTVVVGAVGEASAATGVNGDQSSNGAPGSGAAYVFVRNGSTWSQQAYLKASNSGIDDNFGKSVAVSGDTIVVGANGEDSNATGVDGDQSNNSTAISGAAYVFARNGTTWSQQAYLKASNPGIQHNFGYSVAISGGSVVIGAIAERSNATGVNGNQTDTSLSGAGAAYVFTRAGTTWTQLAYLKASNTEADDLFGWSVAASGETVVVGAHQEDSSASSIDGDQSNNGAPSSGAAYVFAVTHNSPILSIASSGGSIIVSWPASALDFVLEATGSLTPPIDWQPITSGITEFDGTRFYTFANDGSVPARFFRLHLP